VDRTNNFESLLKLPRVQGADPSMGSYGSWKDYETSPYNSPVGNRNIGF
jgi:hypothetical protein